MPCQFDNNLTQMMFLSDWNVNLPPVSCLQLVTAPPLSKNPRHIDSRISINKLGLHYKGGLMMSRVSGASLRSQTQFQSSRLAAIATVELHFYQMIYHQDFIRGGSSTLSVRDDCCRMLTIRIQCTSSLSPHFCIPCLLHNRVFTSSAV